jgi:hypothetical protein
MCTSHGASRWLRAAVLALLPAIVLSGAQADAPRQPVRPPVTLNLGIESSHYRNALQDPSCTSGCRDLLVAVQDSIRGILRHQYPFLDWDATVPAPDTIEIRWIDWLPLALPRTQLAFRIRGPEQRMRTEQFTVSFEGIDQFAARQGIEGWKIETVRREWLDRFEAIVANSDELQLEVFARIPMNTQARIERGFGRVPVRAEDLRVSKDTRPEFGLQAQIVDRVAGTDEVGLFSLTPCLNSSDVGYTCELDVLRYTHANLELGKAEVSSLLAQATVTPTALYVLAVPRPQLNGTVFP